MDTISLIQLVVIVIVGIINFMFFCKMWGMTNDVAEMRRMMEEEHKYRKKTKQTSPERTLPTDDIRIWKKNGMKVKVMGEGKLGLLCKAVDGSDFVNYIPEAELVKEG